MYVWDHWFPPLIKQPLKRYFGTLVYKSTRKRQSNFPYFWNFLWKFYSSYVCWGPSSAYSMVPSACLLFPLKIIFVLLANLGCDCQLGGCSAWKQFQCNRWASSISPSSLTITIWQHGHASFYSSQGSRHIRWNSWGHLEGTLRKLPSYICVVL